jgi:hypothetical protein
MSTLITRTGEKERKKKKWERESENKRRIHTPSVHNIYISIHIYIYIYIYIMMRNLYKTLFNLTWLCQILRSWVIFIYKCILLVQYPCCNQIV